MKLISMREFVLEQLEVKQSTSEFKEIIVNFARFLSQPLTLGMFVPCDEEGNVLEKPINYDAFFRGEISCPELVVNRKSIIEYQQAKERVLFEGFEFLGENEDIFRIRFLDIAKSDKNYIHTCIEKVRTVESLTGQAHLTQSAIKQLGL